jgi:hypothetical protein
VLCPLAVEHYPRVGKHLSQLAQSAGVVEVDVGGDDVFGLFNAQFLGGFLDIWNEHGGPRLDYGACAVLDKVNGEGGISAGDSALQAVYIFSDGFKLNGYFFTSKESVNFTKNQRQREIPLNPPFVKGETKRGILGTGMATKVDRWVIIHVKRSALTFEP